MVGMVSGPGWVTWWAVTGDGGGVGATTRGMEAVMGGAAMDKASGAWVCAWVRGTQGCQIGMEAKTHGLHGTGGLDLLLQYKNERHTKLRGKGVHMCMPCH